MLRKVSSVASSSVGGKRSVGDGQLRYVLSASHACQNSHPHSTANFRQGIKCLAHAPRDRPRTRLTHDHLLLAAPLNATRLARSGDQTRRYMILHISHTSACISVQSRSNPEWGYSWSSADYSGCLGDNLGSATAFFRIFTGCVCVCVCDLLVKCLRVFFGYASVSWHFPALFLPNFLIPFSYVNIHTNDFSLIFYNKPNDFAKKTQLFYYCSAFYVKIRLTNLILPLIYKFLARF